MTDSNSTNSSLDQDENKAPTGIIAFFANNAVAANLMMVFIIIMGLFSYSTIQRQMFPTLEFNSINVSVQYPGASPQEIEENIIIKIEEQLSDLAEVKKSVGNAWRGGGRVNLEIYPSAELSDVLDKVKSRVDSIGTFPAAMEPVTVSLNEFRQEVMNLSIVGDLPLDELKPIAEQIENELLQLNNIQLANAQTPGDEIAIEIKPEVLRKYNLTINDVTQAVRRYSANFSAGQIRTESGMIAVRIENQFYDGEEFRDIPVKIGSGGSRVLLKDVADIKDGFTEGERYFRYNGINAISLVVSATKDQSIIPVASSVNAYMEAKNETLPNGVQIYTVVDFTYYLNGRLDMMLGNLAQGAFLVFAMLALFLRFKLAFWVMIGLPVCFLGAVMLMPAFGITINIFSLFAFIMVLGIVVDDAIVIGESAYSEIESKGGGVNNVVRGAKRVATPATFGVLTTIAVFIPFTMGEGPEGTFFYNIAAVVIFCLIFSLIESKLILPAHIAHSKFPPLKSTSWRQRFNKRFFSIVNGPYRNFITNCVTWRWPVFAVFIAMLFISIGLLNANYVRVVPNPQVPTDYPSIDIEMAETVSDQATIDALQIIEKVIMDVDKKIVEEYGSPMVSDILVFNRGRTSGQVLAPLVAEDDRHFDTFELSRRWREAVPNIPGMKSFTVRDDVNSSGGGGEFGYLLFGPDVNELNDAGRYLIELLQGQEGLFDVSSSIDPVSKEVQMTLKPVAYDLGLDLASIASQVGASFYGGEAQRILRDGEEIKVMVRYPRFTRERFAELKYAVITTPTGQEVLLGDVVELSEKPGISYIRREGGYRSVYVYGSIDEQLVEPGEVVESIADELLPKMQERFPRVKTELGGDIKEQQAQQSEQITFFIAGMIMVYILLAVPLKSYAQPLIVMSVIPFSLTGAIWGHFLLDLDMSLFSTFGLIAAAGVVINDSLVMTDFVNQRRLQGYSVKESVIEAGCARFRAITLTSITTFAGVLPIMFETSLQAAFVIPMAVALGFAVLYATFVTLILVPCLYVILLDLARPFNAIKAKLKRRKQRNINLQNT